MPAAHRPLWTCPRCGKRFVTRNMSHSCVRITVAEQLRGRPRHLVQLYREVYLVGRREWAPGRRSADTLPDLR